MSSQTTAPTKPRFVSLQHGSDYTGLSIKTIRRLIARGDLPAYRAPGSRLIRLDLGDVDRLLRRIPSVGGDAA